MAAHELRIELTETTVITSLQQVTKVARSACVPWGGHRFGRLWLPAMRAWNYSQNSAVSPASKSTRVLYSKRTPERSFQIVKAALELSKRLSLKSVAEGIEDRQTGGPR